MLRLVTAAALATVALAHDVAEPVNPVLGVPGFPDCINPSISKNSPVEVAAQELVCAQKDAPLDTIKIGTIGDSITAGVHSSGGNHTYPGQLQIMLNQAFPGKYSVTNLGACGSTMLKKSNSPYWARPQFRALNTGKWDIIIIMLGTNDAKDPGSHGPNNWLHNCGGPDHTTLNGCTFADDYLSMIKLVKTLGTTAAGPKIFTAIPPPLMAKDSIGANQTVINSVYPKLVPLINAAGDIGTEVIDVFTGMGGSPDWATKFPASCTLATAQTYPPCAWWCDSQSCDECHPNNNGYTQMAGIMLKGLGLGPAPVCKDTEYCCPDAKHCLTPTKTSCASDGDAACGTGEVCCPLTKVCVTPGAACTSPCPDTEFCCPDAKHCLTPVNPGRFCTGAGTQGSCAANQVCCPLLNECVTVGAACTPP